MIKPPNSRNQKKIKFSEKNILSLQKKKSDWHPIFPMQH